MNVDAGTDEIKDRCISSLIMWILDISINS